MKIYKYVGKGKIIYKGAEFTEVKFDCCQNERGKIYGAIEELDINRVQTHKDLPGEFEIIGKDQNGNSIEIKKAFLSQISEGHYSRRLAIKFEALEITYKTQYKSIDSLNDYEIVFELLNVRLFQKFVYQHDKFSLTVELYRNNFGLINQIKEDGLNRLTARAIVKMHKLSDSQFESTFISAKNCIWDCLRLIAFATGASTGWLNYEIYIVSDKKHLIKKFHETPDLRNTKYSGIIILFDINEFLSRTLEKFMHVKNSTGLDYFVDIYLEASSDLFLQTKYIVLCVGIEMLNNFFKHGKKTLRILPKSIFTRVQKELEHTLEGVPEIAEDYKAQIEDIKRKLPDLNLKHIAFKDSFKKMLDDYGYKISYNDIFPNLEFADECAIVRHTAKYSQDNVLNFYKEFDKLMALSERIFLALLDYDGGKFRDRLDNYEIKKFDRHGKHVPLYSKKTKVTKLR